MNKLNVVKLIINIFAVIFVSAYLTFLVDAYTLNTWVKRIFILGYFILLSFLAIKYVMKIGKRNVLMAAALACAVVTLIFTQNVFLPTENEHTFYIQSVKSDSEDAVYGEVKLLGAELDGEGKNLSELSTEGENNWTYAEDADDYVFSPVVHEEEDSSDDGGPLADANEKGSEKENENDNLLSFTVTGKEIKLWFETSSEAGEVRIYDEYGYEEIIPLATDEEEEDGELEHTVDFSKKYSIAERIIFNIGAAITLTFLFKLAFEIVIKAVTSKKSKKEK